MTESRRDSIFFALFLLLTALYFYKLLSGMIIVPGDAYYQNYPLREFYGRMLKEFAFPLWNPYEFAGIPFIGVMQSGALYPPNLIMYFALPAPIAFNLSFLLHFALGGFFTFLYLRGLGLSRISSVMGGVVFAYGGFLIAHKPHTSMLNSAVWFPLVMLFTDRLRGAPSLKRSMALALAVGLQILAGNFQMCLYTYIAVSVLFAFRLFDSERSGRLGFTLYFILGFAVGGIIALPQIYATMELNAISQRPAMLELYAENFVNAFGVYPWTLGSLVFPHLFQGGYGKAIPHSEDAFIVYAGALPIIVALITAIREFRFSRDVRPWAVIAFLGLFLSFVGNTPLGESVWRIPVYGAFRAHGRNILEFSFAVSVLFAIGADRALGKPALLKTYSWAILITGSLSALAVLAGRGIDPALRLGNPAVYVPLGIICLYAGCLWAYKVTGRRALAYALLALVFIEAYSWGGFTDMDGRTASGLKTACEDKGYGFIRSAEGAGGPPPRVAELRLGPYADMFNMGCGVGLFNSYDQLMPYDYARLFELEPVGYSRYWEVLIGGNSLLSMMNVRYLIAPKYSITGFDVIKAENARHEFKPLYKFPGHKISGPNNAFNLTWNLEAGTFVAFFKARALERRASLRMDVFGPMEKEMRDDFAPFNVYPGTIGPEFKMYYRLFMSGAPRKTTVSFLSNRFEPIELKDIAVFKVDNYGPQPVGGEGPVYRKLRSTPAYDIYLNANALPRAYSAARVAAARDVSEVKAMFELNTANPAKDALVSVADFKEIGHSAFAQGSVDVTGYGLHEVSLRTSFDGEGFLVLADQYYPGWKAYADGKETKIYKTNGVMRGVVVPAGARELIFKYRPGGLYASFALSFVSLCAAILVLSRSKPAVPAENPVEPDS